MTVVAAFLCTDGVVVAADSMLSVNIAGYPLAHHKGKKVHALMGDQLFAYAGDQGLGARFRTIVELSHAQIPGVAHPLQYPLDLTASAHTQFASTNIDITNLDLNAVVAFHHQGVHYCSVFEGISLQPRLLDTDHFYAALGTGRVAADPFLRFLYETFCQGMQPPLRDAVFLATWAVQYAIETIPGGVADPIYIGILERAGEGGYAVRELADEERDERLEAIEDARQTLREWRDSLHDEEAPEDIPPKPEPPADGGA